MKVWDMYKPVVHDHLWLWLTQDAILVGRLDPQSGRRSYQLVTLSPKGGYAYQGESVTYDTLNVYTDRIEIATVNTKRRRKR